MLKQSTQPTPAPDAVLLPDQITLIPWRQALKPIASLRLTVVLLALSMLLIFAGTWAQIDFDVWTVQKRYFHSFFCWIPFQLFLPRPQPGEMAFPGRLPMLGGYSLCILLLLNLLAAHALRFKYTIKRLGIVLIHIGIIMLIVGELLTSTTAHEGQMPILVGSSSNYTQDIRETELAILDTSPADHDDVTVIPAARLVKKGTLNISSLPFAIDIDDYFVNSALLGPFQAGKNADPKATAGAGKNITVEDLAPVSGTQSDSSNAPSAYVTLKQKDQSLGTYLLSLSPNLSGPQAFEVDGKRYLIELRWKRTYKPYTIHLLKFTHDFYTGTRTHKNFASLIRLDDPRFNEHREVKIWMNHPLRYNGETFYQSGFQPDDNGTVLQVVKNPSWLMPYFACAIGALGMLIHFGALLLKFIRRQVQPETRGSGSLSASPKPKGKAPALKYQAVIPQPLWKKWLLPASIALIAAIYFISLFTPPPTTNYDLQTFAQIPLSYEGRTMPFDSVARNTVRIISGRDTFVHDGHRLPAIRFLLDVMTRKPEAGEYKVFRIDHPDVISAVGLDPNRKLFSYNEILSDPDKLQQQYDQAGHVEPAQRTLFQKKIIELGDHVRLVARFYEMADLYVISPLKPGEEWDTLHHAVDQAKQNGSPHPAATHFANVLQAYMQDQPEQFNKAVADYHTFAQSTVKDSADKADFETVFNRVEPFYNAMILYVCSFILICVSWLGFTKILTRSAYLLLIVTFLFHTIGLIARIYIQGRPPVTNLYSSAIFIAWGAVALCIGLELFFRNGVATITAAAMGFTSLIVAHNLALSPSLNPTGDTMHMIVAVLDTNFWLATHVVVITLGYASTFLAGLLAIIYIVRGVLTQSLDKDTAKSIARMVYGILCFATLFSFVGTILGGIWADQSWGRFWGWDPKENGAVLIVLWNALILHARWSGIVRERGLMLLAIFGNIVTSWSWFGTNMLGVGLHSYGFMDSALFWLGAFIFSQLALIALGNIPLIRWRSFAQTN